MVSGQRQVRELKCIRFEKTFKLPKNSDTGKITGKFESEILYVTVPKVVEQKEEPKKENETSRTEAEENANEKGNKGDDDDKQGGGSGPSLENTEEERNKQHEGVDKLFEEKLRHDVGPLECLISKLRQNKGIVVAAILAFSLGVCITRQFESGGE